MRPPLAHHGSVGRNNRPHATNSSRAPTPAQTAYHTAHAQPQACTTATYSHNQQQRMGCTASRGRLSLRGTATGCTTAASTLHPQVAMPGHWHAAHTCVYDLHTQQWQWASGAQDGPHTTTAAYLRQPLQSRYPATPRAGHQRCRTRASTRRVRHSQSLPPALSDTHSHATGVTTTRHTPSIGGNANGP